MPRDYYTVLGIPHNATDKEVRAAYRRLARKYHPDVNPGQAEAENRFKEINEAHEVLSDPEKRRLYDRHGHNWRQAQGFGPGGYPGTEPFWGRTETFHAGGFEEPFGDGGLGDLIDRFFGGEHRTTTRSRPRPRSMRLEQPVEVSLEEAYRGATRTIQVTGPTLTRPVRAEVTIPAGVTDGARVRVTPGGQDVVLVVSVRPHPWFQQKGADLYTEVTVPIFDALLGGETQVPTLTGRLLLTIPPETQNGRVFRLTGQGMPHREKPATRGDLYVTVRVTLPSNLSEQEMELVRRLRDLRGGVHGDTGGGGKSPQSSGPAS